MLERLLMELVEYYLSKLAMTPEQTAAVLRRYPGGVTAFAAWLQGQPDLSDETLDANESDLELP